jgi:putative pantetheine hydrolase
VLPDGHVVAALVALNAAGSPVDPLTGLPYGLVSALPGEFDLRTPTERERALWVGSPDRQPFNTTIGVIATDAALTKAGCTRMATIGHDGLARAINPVHTMSDGDALFGLATGTGEPLTGLALREVLIAAADCVSRAVVHALLAAADRPAAHSYRVQFPSAFGEAP